ncbi:MAG: hypothetical protein IT254_05330 [Chitinophagaceae bacterium]|nr:hypothetical protein [Chitinophagaceae bacterium]
MNKNSYFQYPSPLRNHIIHHHIKTLSPMSGELLLSNKFKKIGWILLIPSAIMGIYLSILNVEPEWLNSKVFALIHSEPFGRWQFFSFIEVNLTNTLTAVLFIIGGVLIGFSKLKREDESVSRIRLSSLLWAVWVNYLLLLIAFLFIYGTAFLTIMIYNMFTVLILFIGRFHFMLYKKEMHRTHDKSN